MHVAVYTQLLCLYIYMYTFTEEDSEMMWCQWREEDYPGSLAQLPPGFTPPVEDGNEMGAASACALSITLAIACNVFLILCRRYMGHI